MSSGSQGRLSGGRENSQGFEWPAKALSRLSIPAARLKYAMKMNLHPGLGRAGLGNEQAAEVQYVWGIVRRQGRNHGPWMKRW